MLKTASLGAIALALGLGAAGAQEPDAQKRIDQLIQDLNDDSKEARDKAVSELVKIGKASLPALEKASKSTDTEVKGLAKQAIERIEWGKGVDQLKAHVKERYEEGATVEPTKLKAIGRWFPELRFYDVTHPAGAGAAMGGRQATHSIFSVQKYEPGFVRVMAKGIFCSGAFQELALKQKIQLKDYDTALDFALAFLELYWLSFGQHMVYSGMSSRFEKAEDGWELFSQNYGTSFTFKTDKEGTLTEITQPTYKYWQGYANQKAAEDKAKLEMEKLKLELELLKRQLEEAKKK
jgi:hypothetical protein